MEHQQTVVKRGKTLKEAEKALIMIHGRGACAEDILSLASHFYVEDFALVAPQARTNSWYPKSFLAPKEENEPLLSSALKVLAGIEKELNDYEIPSNKIFFMGFSQGACLTLEYISRNAKKYGGAVAIIGGLIGDELQEDLYTGSLENTRVFIGTSSPDPHVPLERVKETVEILKRNNANVRLEVFENAGHSILEEEINIANEMIFKKI